VNVRLFIAAVCLLAVGAACTSSTVDSEPAAAEPASSEEELARADSATELVAEKPVAVEAGDVLRADLGGYEFLLDAPTNANAELLHDIDGHGAYVSFQLDDEDETWVAGIAVVRSLDAYKEGEVLGRYRRARTPGTYGDMYEALDDYATLNPAVELTNLTRDEQGRIAFDAAISDDADPDLEQEDGDDTSPRFRSIFFTSVYPEGRYWTGIGEDAESKVLVPVDDAWLSVGVLQAHFDDAAAQAHDLADSIEIAPDVDTTAAQFAPPQNVAYGPESADWVLGGETATLELSPVDVVLTPDRSVYVSYADLSDYRDDPHDDPTFLWIGSVAHDAWVAVFSVDSVVASDEHSWRTIAVPSASLRRWFESGQAGRFEVDVEDYDHPTADDSFAFTATPTADDGRIIFQSTHDGTGEQWYGYWHGEDETHAYRMLQFDDTWYAVAPDGPSAAADHIADALSAQAP
jgi:hypothetical protein